MTHEEIIERNVKIARFVGFTPTYPNMPDCKSFRFQKKFPKFDQALYVTECTSTSTEGKVKVKNITQWIKNEEFEFHYNIGWLMPVVELIESLRDCTFGVRINSKTCVIYHIENKEDEYVNITAETKVKAVWLAVLEFIDIWDGLQKLFPPDKFNWDYIDGFSVKDITRTGVITLL